MLMFYTQSCANSMLSNVFRSFSLSLYVCTYEFVRKYDIPRSICLSLLFVLKWLFWGINNFQKHSHSYVYIKQPAKLL